ncbi:hypothetical protein SMQE08_13060 [Serratia marcescens]|uniref:DUF4062 domain-containing protein n=1 Tax=Serratia marcescens TaxID=615 RepID=UPI0030D3229F|nr:hypothetical protein SMQE08_13060 [Serratia marcescens]
MNKRYQVFVSSTYKDLIEERQRVTQTLMEMDCIPAGMEHFPAVDQEQFEFIKKVIDDSDYYLIIIAGKYGSISPDTGTSYTEMEYDYAISQGIKVIAIVHNDIGALSKNKTETNQAISKKLDVFRKKVCSGRLVKFWSKIDDIPGQVSVSLNRTITTFPAIGWVRADRVASDEILSELNELRKENERLKKEGSGHKDVFEKIHFTLKNNNVELSVRKDDYTSWDEAKDYNTTLFSIFRSIAPYLIDEYSEKDTRYSMAFGVSNNADLEGVDYPIPDNQFSEIIADLSSLELIEPSKKNMP